MEHLSTRRGFLKGAATITAAAPMAAMPTVANSTIQNLWDELQVAHAYSMEQKQYLQKQFSDGYISAIRMTEVGDYHYGKAFDLFEAIAAAPAVGEPDLRIKAKALRLFFPHQFKPSRGGQGKGSCEPLVQSILNSLAA